MRVDKFFREAYHRITYPLDVALSRADSFIIGKLRERKWQNILVGLCLTYASAGVWLVWSAWLTREVDDLVFGIVHTIIGVVYATVLALRHSIGTRIDAYALRAIKEQTKRDTRRLPESLWEQTDDVIERFMESSAYELQEYAFIPFVDGATESSRYEKMISDHAEVMYERYRNDVLGG